MYPDPKNNNRLTELPENFAFILSAITTLFMLCWLLWRCRYGFDFTDESFYLIWISNPSIYHLAASQFGFIYHPLDILLGGNIAWLRQANILITFGLAWLLSGVFFKQLLLSAPGSLDGRTNMKIAAAAASLASSSFVIFDEWLLDPNYNSLALQALLLAGTGFLLSEKTSSKLSIAGYLLIGVAGWLAFMAKPTTAAALGLIAILYLLLSGKCNIRLLGISAVTAIGLLLLSAWAIDGSIIGFINRLKGGLQIGEILQAGHTLNRILRIDSFSLTPTEKSLLAASTFTIFFSICCSACRRKHLVFIGVTFPVLIFAISLTIIWGGFPPQIIPDQFQGLQMLGVIFGTIVAAIAAMLIQRKARIRRASLALALCFSTLPYAFVFGTNNNYWHIVSGASIFWVITTLTILISTARTEVIWRVLLPVTAGAQLITIVLVNVGMENPYRQPQPLRLNQYTTSIGPSRSKLILPEGFSKYLNEVNAIAHNQGFKPGIPMIDLSGHSPGTLYSLGAKSIGQPWMVGGYKGSEQLALFMLDQVSCEDIARAWLLLESSGPRKLNPAILKRYGINFEQDYVEVGNLNTPVGKGGYDKSYNEKLLKPTRPLHEAVAACSQQRKISP